MKIRKPQENKEGNIKAQSPYISTSTNHLKPHFSFEEMVQSHCVKNVDKNNQSKLIEFISDLGSLTWGQIQQSRRESYGHEIIERKELKITLSPKISADVKILSFHYKESLAMVGYRVNQVFFILGIDPDYNNSCYDHGGS
jgi:hypothetical protein